MLQIHSYGQLLSLIANRSKVVVIDFYADWCGPCQHIAPLYERMAQYYDPDKVIFCKCNVDGQQECARRFNVQSIPLIVVLVHGETVGTVSGGDVGLAQRHIDMALGLLASREHSAAADAAALAGEGMATRRGSDNDVDAASAQRASTLPSQIAMHMIRVEQATAAKDLIAEKEQCDAVYNLLTTRAIRAADTVISATAEAAARYTTSFSLMDDLLGMPLFPYLASEAYAPSALAALLRNIANRPSPSRHDGSLILNQLLRCVVEMLNCLTWNDMATVQLLHRVMLNLLLCTHTHATLMSSSFFYSAGIETGVELEAQTVLGAFWGLGPVPRDKSALPHRSLSVVDYMTFIALFPVVEKEALAQKVYESEQTVELLSAANYTLVRQLLRSHGTRETTMMYLAQALRLNTDYQKTVYAKSPLSSRFFMTQLQSVLIQAALPIVLNENFTPSTIPAHYVLECVGVGNSALSAREANALTLTSSKPANTTTAAAAAANNNSYSTSNKSNSNNNSTQCCRALIDFGDSEVERVSHYDPDTHPLPPPPGEVYKSSVHLFFLAARAITLCAAIYTEEHENDERHLRQSGAMTPRTRHIILAKKSLYEVLLRATTLARARLDFLNGLAQWLLHVMGANPADGSLPANPPESWCYLPQILIDSVIRATRLASIDGASLHSIIALMLVLMGNTRYFPKPHTHALFSSFLTQLMQDYQAKRVLERHPWFASHVMRGCIYGYIAVQKSTYERVQVRYELSHSIKTFLGSDALCEPVRVELDQKQSTVLERFSHMAVTEVNESVDQLIETLTTMNTMVRDGANLSEGSNENTNDSGGGNNNNDDTTSTRAQQQQQARRRRVNTASNTNNNSNDDEDEEGDDEGSTDVVSYHQHGLSLRSHILLFSASMDMFLQLAVQFPRGVSQNMVSMQISQMLARSLVAFGGPKSKNLKIEHSDRYEFRPREILSRLVRCLTHFRRSKSFLRALCQCGVPLSDVREAMTRVAQRELVTEDLTWKLMEMSNELQTLSHEVDAEEELWDDAPDFALDALLSTPLTQPMALPAEVKSLDDLVYVNQDTIHHLLLTESKHPFTKEYLDEKMLREFNERPEVVAARERVMESIDKWLNEARRARLNSVDEKPC